MRIGLFLVFGNHFSVVVKNLPDWIDSVYFLLNLFLHLAVLSRFGVNMRHEVDIDLFLGLDLRLRADKGCTSLDGPGVSAAIGLDRGRFRASKTECSCPEDCRTRRLFGAFWRGCGLVGEALCKRARWNSLTPYKYLRAATSSFKDILLFFQLKCTWNRV
jgi:hypothetical protein